MNTSDSILVQHDNYNKRVQNVQLIIMSIYHIRHQESIVYFFTIKIYQLI